MASASVQLLDMPAPPAALAPNRWPSSRLTRNAVRLGFAAPLIAIAIIAQRRGVVFPANEILIDRGRAIRDGGADLSGIDHAAPVLPTLVSAVLDGPLAMAIAGALVAGVAIQLVFERLVRRLVPGWLTVVIILGAAAVPAVWFGVLDQLDTVLSLALLTVAFRGFIDFAFNGDTEGGFKAGLAIGVAALCSPVAIVFAVALGIAAPFLARHRYRGEMYAARATVAVLCFPALAVTFGVWFVRWRFGGATFGNLPSEPGLWGFRGGQWRTLGRALWAGAEAVLRSPVYVVMTVQLVLRRRSALVGCLIPVIGVSMARWAGFGFDDLSAFVLLGLLSAAGMPYRPNARMRGLLAAAAVVQLIINIAWPPSAVGVHAFIERLL